MHIYNFRFYIFFSVFILFFLSCSFYPFNPQKISYVNFSLVIQGKGKIFITPDTGKLPVNSEIYVYTEPDSDYVFTGYFGDIKSTNNLLHFYIKSNVSDTVKLLKKPDSQIMIQINSKGKDFVMGSFSPLAKSNEKPSHKVTFDYDFYISKYEITQGLFSSLMGYNPSLQNATSGTFGIGDSLPVYYVSYYEAVLFCNKLSKLQEYDTVYTFSAICKENQKCPYVLENLCINYDRFGFRLPTEAEWEYACRSQTTTDFFWGTSDSLASQYAWHVLNSGNFVHPVGKLKPNNFGLYDMTGNVSEFVNDWLDSYSDSNVINPIGPTNLSLQDFEASYERPVRGGCFKLGTSFLRSSSRTEPYPMPAYAKSEHVGFRIVIGAFFKKSSSQSLLSKDSNDINITCTKSDLISFLGTTKIKIAFVKQKEINRELCIIDFCRPNLEIVNITDSLPVYSPVISPNGQYVVYGSQNIGFSSPSQSTIRSLVNSSNFTRTPPSYPAYMPSFWVDTSAPYDTFIIWAEGTSMNNLPQWIEQRTLKQKINGLVFNGAPQIITSKGSFHGGMSKCGRYLATGYPYAYLYDIRLNDKIRYFLPPYSGRDDSGQVCNVSITPSLQRSDELMFLDFGYPYKPNTVTGKSYGFHSIIFIANSCVMCNNHIKRWYEVPQGFCEWNHVRWSNHPDFATATALPKGSQISTLFLINLKDSSYLPIAKGEGICDPYCWIDPLEVTEIKDPYKDFALYDIPLRSNYLSQIQNTKKLKLFWKRRNNIEAAILGSSAAFYGVNPSYIENFSTINMASFMAEHYLSEILCSKYLLNHAKNLKAVIMGLDPGFLNQNYNWDDPFLNGIYDSQGFQFDKNNNFWIPNIPLEIEQKIQAFNNDSWAGLDSNGYLLDFVENGSWGEPIIDKQDYNFFDTFVQINLNYIKKTIESVSEKRIHFFLVMFPENPKYKNTSFIGRYGPSKNTYSLIVNWIDSCFSSNPYFHFYDANNFGNHDYTDYEAFDPNHLNYKGAQKLSKRLDSLLNLYVK